MGTLFDRIISWDNLCSAHRKAARGKRGKSAAAIFEFNLADHLLDLQHELTERTFQPGQYRSFFIRDPKRRLISAAPFRDRVVHHALCNVIEPLFERSFSEASFANRVGKGTHRALARSQYFARCYRYLLQFDIRQFFPSIDHQILLDILARKIEDEGTLWLIKKVLDSGQNVFSDHYLSYRFDGDGPQDASRVRGLPIGNLTSQFWANCYLNPFDHFIQRELGCKAYVRYVDDGLVFADDKATLWRWREAIVQRLCAFRMQIHPGAHPRPVSEGFAFLGFVVFPTHRRLKRRNVIVYRRRLKSLVAASRQTKGTRQAVTVSLRGWINHARYGDTWALRKSVVASACQAAGGLG
jgi:RNA-directed DNA polymerase